MILICLGTVKSLLTSGALSAEFLVPILVGFLSDEGFIEDLEAEWRQGCHASFEIIHAYGSNQKGHIWEVATTYCHELFMCVRRSESVSNEIRHNEQLYCNFREGSTDPDELDTFAFEAITAEDDTAAATELPGMD